MGLSPFIVGVVIVGLGTSFPELVSSIVAVMEGVPQVPAANAIGSNIANILLVIGLSAVVGKRLTVTKNLIDLDLPLFAITTVLFLGMAYDGAIGLGESLMLLAAYGIYLIYTIVHEDDVVHEVDFPALEVAEKRKVDGLANVQVTTKDIAFLFLGGILLAVGAKYLIDSVVELSSMFEIGAGSIALAAIALGTSLPEVLVSVKAAYRKQSEVALGNIFGSNVFNLTAVVGVSGLFGRLTVDTETLGLGVPVLMAASLLFVISGISKRIHNWEGWLYLLLYVGFLGKLFGAL